MRSTLAVKDHGVQVTVWALRLSGFAMLPLLLVLHPGFGAFSYFGVLAATVLLVPVERALERRFFGEPAIERPHLYLVENES